MSERARSIAEVLQDARGALSPDADILSVDMILEVFHERGFGFLLFLFALPAALPLPGLGVNLLVASPLLFLTAQQALGCQAIWLPAGIRRRKISRDRMLSFFQHAERLLRRIEFLIAPRLGFVTQGVFSNLIGLCGLVMALSILVPLPLTNTVPAMGIALMSLGVLLRDGLAVVAGAVLGLSWVLLLCFVAFTVGVEGFAMVKDVIRDFF